MKKTLALVISIALILSVMVVPASAAFTSAYTGLTNLADTTFTHSLELTTSPYSLAEGEKVQYDFVVGDAMVALPTGLAVADAIATPNITIDSVSYTNADTFDAATHIASKDVAVHWDTTTFKQPGIYYWPVTKSINTTETVLADVSKLSNEKTTSYLFVVVEDDNGTLKVAGNPGLLEATPSASTVLGTKLAIPDQYPAKQVDLEVTKSVSGKQASKDLYFLFTIAVTLPAGSVSAQYTVSGDFDPLADVQGSPYSTNKAATEGNTFTDNKVTLAAGANTVKVWLKNGDSFKINDLPYGSSYKITETIVQDYVPSYAASGTDKNTNDSPTAAGTAIADSGDGIVQDTFLKDDAKIDYTNTKEAITPTGIVTEAGAPVMGILLAAGLFMIMVITKRRKAQAE